MTDHFTNHRSVTMGAMIVGLALLVGLGYFAVGGYLAIQLTQPERRLPGDSPGDFGLPFEEVTVHTRDGLALAGWFIPTAGAGCAVVLVHGLGGCRSCEFDGRFMEFAARLHAGGFKLLMIDLRAHGGSEGRNFTLGDHERWDVLAAVDWLRQRGSQKIGVLGVSLGGVSAVKAAVDPEGGQNIKALVLDSSFGDVRDVLERLFPEESGLPNFFLPGALFMGRVLLHADVDAVRPVEDLPKIKVPLMLIFGGQDDTVPVAHFHAMVAAHPDARAWLVDKADHARIYNVRPDEYTERVGEFFAHALR